MTATQRYGVAYIVVLAGLIAIGFGHMEIWQWCVYYAVIITGLILAPKPWEKDLR